MYEIIVNITNNTVFRWKIIDIGNCIIEILQTPDCVVKLATVANTWIWYLG